MKKMFAILFLISYIFSTTEMYQLLKLPILVEHFFEHKEKNPAISVLDFLEIHYAENHLENHPHDDDYEQDQKLPFITHHEFLTIVFTLNPPLVIESNHASFPHQDKKIIFYNDADVNSGVTNSIWQPPKFC